MEAHEFEALFRATWAPLVSFAARRVDLASAQDVAAETLFAAWRAGWPAPITEADHDEVRHRLFAVAHGRLLNVLRAQRRRGRLLELLQGDAVTRPPAPDSADLVIRPRPGDLDDPPALLHQLPESERVALAYFIQGHRVGEIAAILGRSPSAVSMRLSRARARLLGLLTEAERD